MAGFEGPLQRAHRQGGPESVIGDSVPTISVVVPCFNARKTLASSLESILRQSFADFEVVWFDDGSTDGSAEVVESYAGRDPRIRLLRSEHVGIVEALRRACSVARGRYIARMDADDVAYPERFSKQVRYLEGHPEAGLCGTQVRTVGEDIGTGRERYEAWVNALTTHEAIVRDLFVECPVAHPTLMIRRDVFEAVGGYEDHGWAEDYDLLMRCFGAGVRMGNVPEPLLEWRNGAGRLSLRDDRYSLAKFRALKRHYLFQSYLKDRPVFFQWGAGEVGKKWLAEWEGLRPEAVAEVNPRKLGKVIHGTRVIAPSELPQPGEGFTVVAVGAPGAREDIRGWFGERRYTEISDYIFLA